MGKVLQKFYCSHRAIWFREKNFTDLTCRIIELAGQYTARRLEMIDYSNILTLN